MNDDDPGPVLPDHIEEGAMLLVDKPLSWTSFDVVNKLRNRLKTHYRLRKIKVGHAGTLDPMATGLLIICTGRDTKQLDTYQGLPKEYTGVITLGATTPSYDAETAVDQTFPISHITGQRLEEARQQFIGDLEQLPPVFSAIKVDGQPLYKKARRGESIQVEPRKISIYAFDITHVALPEVHFRVRCSKGTYIRSLAYDFGQALGSGGYLSALRRTAIGPYQVQQAWNLDDLVDAILQSPVPEARD
jgi:tRNA pseudouridine55 synthase